MLKIAINYFVLKYYHQILQYISPRYLLIIKTILEKGYIFLLVLTSVRNKRHNILQLIVSIFRTIHLDTNGRNRHRLLH